LEKFAVKASDQGCQKMYSRILPDMSCKIADMFFETKKQPVGAMSRQTSMSRIRYNPESIQRMMVWMARRIFRCQRELQLGRLAQGECEPA
jgi:hypothetical protein